MGSIGKHSTGWAWSVGAGLSLLVLLFTAHPTQALTPIPTPEPKPGSYGLEATKTQDPPKTGATITTPGNGASYSTSPVRVSGICPTGLLVQVYNNGVMVGASMCENGSFSLEVSLFAGTNELSAIVYDDLDQAGPVSNLITINYTNTSFVAFGELITLTSSYGRRSSPVNSMLSWPLQLSGGTGPYAFSIDWGDGSAADLKSQSLAGLVNIGHIYKRAGIYQVNVKATDANGVSAFLQVIAVSSGQVDGTTTTTGTEKTKVIVRVVWIPAVVALCLLLPAFWFGRRSQLVSLRRKLLKERDSYKDK